MGSPGYLKDQYGTGYVIILRSIVPENQIDEYLQQNFTGILEKKGTTQTEEIHYGQYLLDIEF